MTCSPTLTSVHSKEGHISLITQDNTGCMNIFLAFSLERSTEAQHDRISSSTSP